MDTDRPPDALVPADPAPASPPAPAFPEGEALPAEAGKLTERQQRFVLEFTRCLCGVQAAIKAGYTKANARTYAASLLANPTIQAAVSAEKEKYARLIGLETYAVVRELKEVAFSDVTRFAADPRTGIVTAGEDASPHATKAISSVARHPRFAGNGQMVYDVTIKLWDKVAALKLLGQYLDMWKDQGGVHIDAPAVLVIRGVDGDAALGRLPGPPALEAPADAQPAAGPDFAPDDAPDAPAG